MTAVTVDEFITLYDKYLSKKKPIPGKFTPDSNTILLAAIKDSRIADFFSQQSFENDWRFLIEQNIYPLSVDPKTFLVTQPGINPFDLAFGHFLYQEAHRLMNVHNQNTLISRAKNHYHFDAMEKSIQKLVEQISSSTGGSEKTWGEFFNEIKLIGEKHGTPGFLVGMQAYLKLGNNASAHKKKEDARCYYFQAMRYAYAAHFAKHRSIESIHNAYKGTPPKITIEHVETDLKHHLTAYDFSLAENQGSALANINLNHLGSMLNATSSPSLVN